MSVDVSDQESSDGSITRPGYLPMISSSSSQMSQISRGNSEVDCHEGHAGNIQIDSDAVDFESLTEKPSISKLMLEYAEQDAHYDGLVVVTPLKAAESDKFPGNYDGPPRPFLYVKEDGTPTSGIEPSLWMDHLTDCYSDEDICVDGLHFSKLKPKNKRYMSLRLDRGQQDLSIYSNGQLVDQVVTTPLGSQPPPGPDNSRRCMYIYHNAGGTSPGASLLCLNPDQSPQLKPLYDPKDKLYSEVISYHEFGADTSPGTIAVKVESKTHVYLVLDYTDEQEPKLVTIEEHLMEPVLLEMKSGKSTRKLKPIVNVHNYPGSRDVNNTAFYFKTDKDYYFICVEKDNIHLGVKKVPASSHTNKTYLDHLIFGPKYLDQCPKDSCSSMEEVDRGDDPTVPVNKTAVATSPMLTAEGGQGGPEQPRKCSASSPESDNSSPGNKFGSEGVVGVDSGLELESGSGDDSVVNMPQATA